VFIDYVAGVQTHKFVDQDFKTISPADYTVEFEVSKKMWENFLAMYYS
jgi:hypothetical protein